MLMSRCFVGRGVGCRQVSCHVGGSLRCYVLSWGQRGHVDCAGGVTLYADEMGCGMLDSQPIDELIVRRKT